MTTELSTVIRWQPRPAGTGTAGLDGTNGYALDYVPTAGWTLRPDAPRGAWELRRYGATIAYRPTLAAAKLLAEHHFAHAPDPRVTAELAAHRQMVEHARAIADDAAERGDGFVARAWRIIENQNRRQVAGLEKSLDRRCPR